LERIRLLVGSSLFVARHRQSETDFTRQRILTFKVIVLLLLAKTTKSLQLALNEVVPKLSGVATTVSNTAYSKARAKLRHTAFIELNTVCVVTTMYEDDDYKTYNGLRVLAIDGSKIMLPNNTSTIGTFGSFDSTSPIVSNTYCMGLASVLYDVLNGVCIDARLAHGHAAETDLANESLQFTNENDLVIYDRGYCSFRMATLASATKGHFLIRCHRRSFGVTREMFEGKGPDDIVVTIEAGYKHKVAGMKDSITVRFVRVVLDTGEIEVLMTSLLDQDDYRSEDFKDLYWYRWGIETFYGILKGRLDIENFTGLSAESVLQDFHASVFLTGMEAIFTEDANEELQAKDTKHDYKVNKAVSFNALKNSAFDIIFSERSLDEMIEHLDALFLTNPVAIRPGRSLPRTDPGSLKRLNFWKRKRKSVY
jgi:hypothetical protein